MAQFAIGDRTPSPLPGDFELEAVAPHQPSQAESLYLQKLAGIVDRLVAEATSASAGGRFSAPMAAALQGRQAAAVSELRQDAVQFAAGRLDPLIAADNVLVRWGKYLADVERLSVGRLFTAREKFAGAANGQPPLAIDLEIMITEGLPAPEDAASEEKEALFIAIYSTLTVIKAVCRDMRETARKWWEAPKWLIAGESASVRADRTLDEYVRKLAGVSRLGLSGSHTALARVALSELCEEFVAQEAGRIKNAYARRLGVIAAFVALLFLAPYILIERETITSAWWIKHKSFLLAGVGAALGTWLSFAIRNVALTFDQLGSIETDLLNPGLRVVFVLGLTLAAYLLFWTGAIGITIGDLQADQAGFRRMGSIAFLVGIFCGLSERALASAISGRSATFVGGIAGAK